MTVPLLQPGSLKGFASARHPTALPDGTAALISNARLTSGVPQARAGDASVNASIASGAVRGSACFVVDGVTTMFLAIGDGVHVTVWNSVDEGAHWSNITPTSGAYGDTRLLDGNGPVRFQLVRTHPRPGLTAYDLVVCQNGVDQPRIYGKSAADSTAFGSGVAGMSICSQPPQPPSDGNLVAFTAFSSFFPVGNAGSISCSSVDAIKFKVVSSGVSASINFVQLQIANTWAAGKTGSVAMASGSVDLSNSKQLVMVVDTDTASFWDNIGISITDNGAANNGVSKRTITVHDAVQQIGSRTKIALTASTPSGYGNVAQMAFPLQVGQPFDYSHVTSLTFYWTGAAPAGTQNADAYMIAGSGQFQGTSVFGVSYAASDTRAEGPIRYVAGNTPGSVSRSGGPLPQTTGGPDVTVADDARISYDYQVYASAPPAGSVVKGVDRANLYAQLPGQTQYFLVGSAQAAAYSGGTWTGAAGGYVLFGAAGLLWSGGFGLQALALPDPGSDALSLPAGTAMVVANGRFFVGSGPTFYYSQFQRPFLFRSSVRFFDAQNADPLSAGSFTLDGETIQSIVPIGSVAGAPETSSPVVLGATLFFLTNTGMFHLSGFDSMSLNRPIPVAPYGTASPLTVARSMHGFYWLDQLGQVRFWNGWFAAGLSVDMVDDRSAAIPAARVQWACAAVARERYFLGYTPVAGSANSRVLVWSERHQTWESEDTFSGSALAESLLAFHSPSTGGTRLFAFSEGSGTVSAFEYAPPGNTNTVAFGLSFAETAPKAFVNAGTSKRMSFCSDLTSGGLSVTGQVLYPMSGTTTSISFTIAAGSNPNRAWKVGLPYGPTQIEPSFQPSIVGSVPGGTRFYFVGLEVEDRSNGPSA